MPTRKWLPLTGISILHTTRERALREKAELETRQPRYDFRVSYMRSLKRYRVLAARKEGLWGLPLV